MKAIQALKEAESYNGPSLVICYCPCANQGIKGGLTNSIKEEKDAVACGYFTTFRYDPRLSRKASRAYSSIARSRTSPSFATS
jgi:pyruvate-ferredoxin/flavodoxin oxidoreductase